MKTILICLLLQILSFTGAKANDFTQWLSRVLGFGTGYIDSATGVRGGGETDSAGGNEIVLFDLVSHGERVLWTGSGLRSPALVSNSTVAVLRNAASGNDQSLDGIWLISLVGAEPRHLVVGSTFSTIFGRTPDGKSLIAAQSAASGTGQAMVNEACSVDLKSGHVSVFSGSIQKLPPGPVEALPHIGQFLNGRYLTNGNEYKIKIAEIHLGTPLKFKFFGPNDETAEMSEDTARRFDPIWLNENAIIYIKDEIP